MGQTSFHFKKFVVDHSRCAMKVGTDGVLMGAYTSINEAKSILDIGTGSGLIALMLAQRSTAGIDAIDIDAQAVEQATINFSNSPWSGRLRAIHTSLADYSPQIPTTKYDLIVSNPPYFTNSLKSGNRQRDTARHDDTLPLDSLVAGVARLLHPDGRFTLILPAMHEQLLDDAAWQHGLSLSDLLYVANTEQKAPKRIIATYSFTRHPITKKHLFIRTDDNLFSEQYIRLTADYYLGF